MNDDNDLLHQYFTARSPHVDVPAAGTAAVVERGRRRHRRRTAVKVLAVVGVLAIGGGVIAQVGGDDGQQVDSLGQAPAAAPLSWTVVDAPKGIGGFALTEGAATSDGAVYQLSTGPASTIDDTNMKRVLYRSTDDVEWTPAPLPGDLSARSISADGDRLYAVGTAPAGGGVGVRLASSVAGEDWSSTEVPLDFGALAAGFPGELSSIATQVASAHGTTVVAASVQAYLTGPGRPTQVDWDSGWTQVPAGIQTFLPCGDEGSGRASGSSTTLLPEGATSTVTAPPTTTIAAGAEAPAKPDEKESCDGAGGSSPELGRLWTWADLGMTEQQRALANGQTYLFTVGPDGTLTQTGVVDGDYGDLRLLGADDGFWLVRTVYSGPAGQVGSTSVVRSPDGRAWDAAPSELPGYQSGSGLLAGRPVVATQTDDGRLSLTFLAATGSETVGLDFAAHRNEAGSFVSSAIVFGPLGMAFTTTSNVDEQTGQGRTVVVHSRDGRTFDEEALPAPPDGQTERVNNLSVSADAVTVRLNSYPKGAVPGVDGSRPTQRVLVGTPR